MLAAQLLASRAQTAAQAAGSLRASSVAHLINFGFVSELFPRLPASLYQRQQCWALRQLPPLQTPKAPPSMACKTRGLPVCPGLGVLAAARQRGQTRTFRSSGRICPLQGRARLMTTGLPSTAAMGITRGDLGEPEDAYANLDGLLGLAGQEVEPGGKLHPTMQLIVDRALSGSAPGARTDPHKLGLVVEGGGMRGAVSAGMLVALYDLGLQRVFDSVYGSSAGAINLTYFLAGQREGVDVYANNLTNKNFIDLSRLWKRGAGPVLDLSFLLENVMMDTVPLNFEAVMDSQIPLKAVASCVQKLQPVILEDFSDRLDLVTCLKASANVPAIAGSPIHHRGHCLVDAAVFEPIPFPMAIRDGCSHILACCSRPDPSIPISGPFRRRLGKAVSYAVRKAVLSPPYMRSAWNTRFEQESSLGMSIDDILAASMDDAEASLPVCNGSHIYPVFPGRPAAYAPLCTDPSIITAGVQEGKAAVYQALQGRIPALAI